MRVPLLEAVEAAEVHERGRGGERETRTRASPRPAQPPPVHAPPPRDARRSRRPARAAILPERPRARRLGAAPAWSPCVGLLRALGALPRLVREGADGEARRLGVLVGRDGRERPRARAHLLELVRRDRRRAAAQPRVVLVRDGRAAQEPLLVPDLRARARTTAARARRSPCGWRPSGTPRRRSRRRCSAARR